MPPWNELLQEFQVQGTDQNAIAWLQQKSTGCLIARAALAKAEGRG